MLRLRIPLAIPGSPTHTLLSPQVKNSCEFPGERSAQLLPCEVFPPQVSSFLGCGLRQSPSGARKKSTPPSPPRPFAGLVRRQKPRHRCQESNNGGCPPPRDVFAVAVEQLRRKPWIDADADIYRRTKSRLRRDSYPRPRGVPRSCRNYYSCVPVVSSEC